MIRKVLELLLKSFIPKNDNISLISEFSQIESLLKLKMPRKFEYFYLNKVQIHKILYDNEQIIKIQSNTQEKNLANLFYIILLIKYQSYLTNYIYEFDYIQNANNLRKNSQNVLTNFILSMIVIELINNYKEAEEFYDFKFENQLNEIYEENLKIKNSYHALNQYNFDLNIKEIESNNLEDIYSKIILSLIQEGKLENYEYSNNIFEQLNFGEIHITENIFAKIVNIFNDEKEFIKKYKIVKIEDLYNEKIINFYFAIFKYIFKDSFYIYNIPFLYKIRKAVLKIIKFENNKLSELNKNNNKNNKKEYVIAKFCDSKYYLIKYLGAKYDQLKQILEYYTNYLFETKKEEIKLLNDFINNINLEIEYEKYLQDFEKAKKMNERIEIIKFLLEETEKSYENEKEVSECAKIWEGLEKAIKDKKIKNIKKNYMEILKKYFNDSNNKDLLISIFTEEIYEYFINEIKEKNSEKNEEENILQKGLYKDIEKIDGNQNKSTDEKAKENNKSIIIVPTPDESKLNITVNNNNNESVLIISKVSEMKNNDSFFDESDFHIMTHIKAIGKHKKSAGFIKETENGYFISGGGDKNLLIYNPKFENVSKIDKNEIITNVTELKNTVQTEITKRDIKLVTSTEKKTYLITFNTNKLDAKVQKTDIPSLDNFSSCIEIRKNNHLICSNKGLYHVTDLFSKIISAKSQQINSTKYKEGLKINKKFIAITSNKIINGSKNILEFYNANSQRIVKTIQNYSFISSTNGLALMPGEESQSKNKYLLCACKKYESNKMNGILIVSEQIESNIEIKNPFYNTGNFEVFCFCPLSYKERQSYKKIFDNDKLIPSDYFLVGGYDQMKGRGLIKLFKLNQKENIEDTTIEFIQDIDIENTKNFKGFKQPISCIIQSKNNGQILVSCWDGNVHLFSCPNIDNIINYEQKIKNDLIDNEETTLVEIGIE